MLNKEQIKNILKVGITLCAITAVSALVLAFVNSVASPIIAKNTEAKQTAAMMEVLSTAKEFSTENLINEDTDKIVKAIYEGKDAGGKTCGYAVMVSPNGYGGAISMTVGVDADLKITGVEIISQSETPSLGSKCTGDDFKNQYIGKTTGIKVKKRGAKGNEIDAISSATITSKAVTLGVNTAIESVKLIKGDK